MKGMLSDFLFSSSLDSYCANSGAPGNAQQRAMAALDTTLRAGVPAIAEVPGLHASIMGPIRQAQRAPGISVGPRVFGLKLAGACLAIVLAGAALFLRSPRTPQEPANLDGIVAALELPVAEVSTPVGRVLSPLDQEMAALHLDLERSAAFLAQSVP